MEIFSMVLSLLSGVALFLFGMSLMGDGLKQVAGNKLEAFLYKMTNSPLKGVALGTGVTSVIQSSWEPISVPVSPDGSYVFLILRDPMELRKFYPLQR